MNKKLQVISCIFGIIEVIVFLVMVSALIIILLSSYEPPEDWMHGPGGFIGSMITLTMFLGPLFALCSIISIPTLIIGKIALRKKQGLFCGIIALIGGGFFVLFWLFVTLVYQTPVDIFKELFIIFAFI